MRTTCRYRPRTGSRRGQQSPAFTASKPAGSDVSTASDDLRVQRTVGVFTFIAVELLGGGDVGTQLGEHDFEVVAVDVTPAGGRVPDAHWGDTGRRTSTPAPGHADNTSAGVLGTGRSDARERAEGRTDLRLPDESRSLVPGRGARPEVGEVHDLVASVRDDGAAVGEFANGGDRDEFGGESRE